MRDDQQSPYSYHVPATNEYLLFPNRSAFSNVERAFSWLIHRSCQYDNKGLSFLVVTFLIGCNLLHSHSIKAREGTPDEVVVNGCAVISKISP